MAFDLTGPAGYTGPTHEYIDCPVCDTDDAALRTLVYLHWPYEPPPRKFPTMMVCPTCETWFAW